MLVVAVAAGTFFAGAFFGIVFMSLLYASRSDC